MNLSLFLAKVLGLYLIIVCGAVLLRRREFQTIADSFFRESALMIFSGAFILPLGLLLVLSHNIWEWNFRGAITFLGWLTVLKGVLRLSLSGEQLQKLARPMIASSAFPVLITLFLALGLWLTWSGFSG